jgi:hypothetical protein
LHGIFPGSWIDANFYIWIGHADDQLAWSQVAEAREALERAAPGLEPATLAKARQEMFIAEGSDWCWWYGDDHSSEHDAEFDDLFRRHLRNVYRLIGVPIPDELFVSNISTAASRALVVAPTARITPVIDGEDTSYFEWLCAGVLEVDQAAGAMHQTDRAQALVTHIRFGFDREALCVRLDCGRPASDLLREGWTMALTFLRPAGIRLVCRGEGAGVRLDRHVRSDAEAGVEVARLECQAAAGTVLEVRVPLTSLGAVEGDVAFFVSVSDPAGTELERHPSGRPIEVAVPDARFEARNWTA